MEHIQDADMNQGTLVALIFNREDLSTSSDISIQRKSRVLGTRKNVMHPIKSGSAQTPGVRSSFAYKARNKNLLAVLLSLNGNYYLTKKSKGTFQNILYKETGSFEYAPLYEAVLGSLHKLLMNKSEINAVQFGES